MKQAKTTKQETPPTTETVWDEELQCSRTTKDGGQTWTIDSDSKEGLHTREEDLQICEEAIYRSWDYLMAMGHFTSPTDNARKLENYLIQARVRILEVKNERKALLDALEEITEMAIKWSVKGLTPTINKAQKVLNNAKNI